MTLTRAERRALRLAHEIGQHMPQQDRLTAVMHASKESTFESLRAKGLLVWSAHRGGTYHLTPEAMQIAARQ